MTRTTQPTIDLNAAPTLAALREYEDLEYYFDRLGAGEDATIILDEALFDAGDDQTVIDFCLALLRERLGIELEPGEELSELSIIELLDPAKGFPPAELRHKAAMIALLMPWRDAAERCNHSYLAACLTDVEPGLGLAVTLNTMRASYGLEPTGW